MPDEDSPVQAPAANMANPVVFACSPAGLNEDLLDYSKSEHIKIYKLAILPMTPLYDGKPHSKTVDHKEAILQLKAAYASMMEDLDNQE